jgi:hypothetical protein
MGNLPEVWEMCQTFGKGHHYEEMKLPHNTSKIAQKLYQWKVVCKLSNQRLKGNSKLNRVAPEPSAMELHSRVIIQLSPFS